MSTRPADNPFSSRRIDSLAYRFLDGSLDEVLAGLRQADGRGAIVGPHGSGKTTLLEELATHLTDDPVWIRLDAGTARPLAVAITSLPTIVADRHVFVDGAEQLAAVAWWRFRRRVRRARTLTVTSHRPGRLPTLIECRTSPALLDELVSKLDPATAHEVDLEALYRRRGGNIRLCLRDLYDLHSGQRLTGGHPEHECSRWPLDAPVAAVDDRH